MSLLDYEGLLKRKKPVAEKEKTENPLPLNLEKQLPTVSSSPKEDTARSNVEVVPKKGIGLAVLSLLQILSVLQWVKLFYW